MTTVVDLTVSPTANTEFPETMKHSSIINGKSVHEWVQLIHKNNCSVHGWSYAPLCPGMFTYDTHVRCIYYFTMFPTSNVKKAAAYVHDAWCDSYIYWRDDKPWTNTKIYYTPYKTLGNDDRDYIAASKFTDLDDDDQNNDIIMAKFLITNFDLLIKSHK